MSRFLQKLPKEVVSKIRRGADDAYVALARKVEQIAATKKWVARHKVRKKGLKK